MAGDGAKEEMFEVMVDSNEFDVDDAEINNLKTDVTEKKSEPKKPSRFRDTDEDINIGPSVYAFMGQSARRDQEMADAEEEDHPGGRKFHSRDTIDESKNNEVAHALSMENPVVAEDDALFSELDKLTPEQMDLLKQVLDLKECDWNDKREGFMRYFGAHINK